LENIIVLLFNANMNPKQGTGSFQWNAGGWFGSQLGSTLWLAAAACMVFPKSPSAAAWLAFCAVAPNIMGCILWTKRDKLAPYPAIQCLVATIGVFTLLAILLADHFLLLPVIDSRLMTSPRRVYWVVCLFPVLMAWFAFLNKTRGGDPDARVNAAPPAR